MKHRYTIPAMPTETIRLRSQWMREDARRRIYRAIFAWAIVIGGFLAILKWGT